MLINIGYGNFLLITTHRLLSYIDEFCLYDCFCIVIHIKNPKIRLGKNTLNWLNINIYLETVN